ALRLTADTLIAEFGKRDFNRDDAVAIAKGVVAVGTGGDDLAYSAAQQQTMALASIIAAMQSGGFADENQLKTLNEALRGLYEAVGNDQTYRPDPFVNALRRVEANLPH